jgi:hypothetical protein
VIPLLCSCFLVESILLQDGVSSPLEPYKKILMPQVYKKNADNCKRIIYNCFGGLLRLVLGIYDFF